MADRVRYGIAAALEEEADRLIFGSLADVTSREAKSDILTPWKEKHRKSREILSTTGHPIDGNVRRGMFHRAYNRNQTHLNSYDGATSSVRLRSSGWEDENGEAPVHISPAMKQAFGVQRDGDE